eukprot:TRINITY_DN2057_c0_g2_i13.p1 TRINITY_DN2057_c0_g2~~TRINITY_DN2057_c0_g2_i13.p1  ORF type:complete len:160 (-),score=31.63 TRINITY_DN2057_c0_g2_i13:142-621(-)
MLLATEPYDQGQGDSSRLDVHVTNMGTRNNKKPVDVMLVKIRELCNGTFIGKDLLDPDIKDFVWKYNLDDQLLHRLIKTMKKRGKHKKQDLRDMDERIGNAKHPSGLLVRMLEGIEEHGKMPPAPGWLVQGGHAGSARREPADTKADQFEKQSGQGEVV